MSTKEECMPVLAEHGLLQMGTPIETILDARLERRNRNHPAYRALVVKPSGRQNSVRWEQDGQLYSLTALCRELRRRRLAQWSGIHNPFAQWQRVGTSRHLLDEANDFLR
jgi:hypothetical protein